MTDQTVKLPECPHDDWIIEAANSARPVLCGTCTKCWKERPLHELLNNWKARVERELAAAIRSAKLPG